jgi:tRNA pseudouridine38-40 synthase
VQADAFCHSMVRALVGASVAVGDGRIAPERLGALLAEERRSNEFIVMPAHGLTLTEVVYPEPGLLAGRAEQTRARRR